MMNIHVIELNGLRCAETDPSEPVISEERSAVDLIGFCGEHETERLLMYAGNVPEAFFDLKSGLAGAVLQKLTNYHMKVALVVTPERIQGRFAEFSRETNRGNQFRTFLNREDALSWLTRD